MATTEKGIYYPNDGTKTADVLADLKQMAESVDEAIGKEVEENKYNDADIKKDISDIKEEQQTQNKNIEQNTTKNKEQDELISKLKSALINVETEEAKSLHIEDASTVPAQLKVIGNQEQDGEPSPENEVPIICLGSNKNLFDEDNVNLISLNATNQENGTFSAATNQKHIYIECKPLTTYTITKSIKDNSVLGIYETSEIPAVGINYHQLYLSTNSNGIKTITTSENIKYLDLRLNSNPIEEEALQEILDTLKIEEGDIATSYSPYRAR